MAAPTLSTHYLNLGSFVLTDGAVRIATKPWFSESTDRCKSPTVFRLLGWREWWWFMVFSVWCRAQSPAPQGFTCHHELCNERMLWRVTDLAWSASAKVMTLEIYCCSEKEPEAKRLSEVPGGSLFSSDLELINPAKVYVLQVLITSAVLVLQGS